MTRASASRLHATCTLRVAPSASHARALAAFDDSRRPPVARWCLRIAPARVSSRRSSRASSSASSSRPSRARRPINITPARDGARRGGEEITFAVEHSLDESTFAPAGVVTGKLAVDRNDARNFV